MDGSAVKSGDRVFFIDADRIRWGPWKAVDVTGDKVTVLIDGWATYRVNARHLEMADEDRFDPQSG